MKRRLLDAGLALAAFLGAFLLRVLPGGEDVLGGASVRFRTPDSLYHMRVVDLVLARFPRPVLHDPLLLWPNGMDLPTAPLFDGLVAGSALLLGRGTPSPHLVDLCGAILPPLFGALLAAATYLLGRRTLGREGAALAAALIAVMPGQLLQRCALGYADHHAPALLFLGLFLLLLHRSFGALDDRAGRRDALAAGGSLALLTLTWQWGAAFALPAAGWAVLDAGTRHGSRALARLSRALGAAAVLILPASVPFPILRKPAVLVALLALAAAATDRAATRRGRLAVAAALILVSSAAALAVAPDSVREVFARLTPSATARTVGEARPLLSTGPGLTPLFRELWTGLFGALLGAGLAVRRLRERPENGLLLVFLAFTAVLALCQNRFAGEMAIVSAILAGLVPGHLVTAGDGVPARRAAIGRAFILSGLAVLLVVPAALAAPDEVRTLPPSTDADWEAAMAFLRQRTPEPLPAANARQPASVLTWWDNGYVVVRLGHRIPVTNPTQEEAGWAARALLSENETEALALLSSRAVGHVVLDSSLPFFSPPGFPEPIGQFRSLPVWAGLPSERYWAPAAIPGPDGVRKTTVFFPDYYRTLAFRLWRYGGEATVPAGAVLAVRLASGAVVQARRFGSYEEASRFVTRAGAGWRLASEDAYATCVPLEPWRHFRRIFSSSRDVIRGKGERVGRVGILAVAP